MSYEGREVYICANGHVLERDCYIDDYIKSVSEETCKFCGTKFEHVGGIDDTNGDAVAYFKLKCIEEEERDVQYKDGVMTMRLKPARFLVERDEDRIFNYDTGEELDYS